MSKTKTENEDAEVVEQTEEKHKVARPVLMKADLGKIIHNPLNPRPIDEEHVNALMDMIRADPEGQVRHPIQVLPADDSGNFVILNGHHRHEAVKRLGKTSTVISVTEMEPKRAALEVVTSNHSLPLTMLAVGRHYLAMTKSGIKMTQKEYAQCIGKTEAYISYGVTAAELYYALPDDMRKALDERDAKEGNLATALGYIAKADKEDRNMLVESFASRELTLPDVRQLVDEAAKIRAARIEQLEQGLPGMNETSSTKPDGGVEGGETGTAEIAPEVTTTTTTTVEEIVDATTNVDYGVSLESFILRIKNVVKHIHSEDPKDDKGILKKYQAKLQKLLNEINTILAKS